MPTQNQPELSLLNQSRYPLQENEAGYCFVTDFGTTYQLTFKSDQAYFPDDSFARQLYSFSLIAVTPRTPLRDPKIESTVIDALRCAFNANPLLILSYVCSLEDALERHRRILFGQWYQRYGVGFVRLPFSSAEARIYAAAIFREDHPDQAEIVTAFRREYNRK